MAAGRGTACGDGVDEWLRRWLGTKTLSPSRRPSKPFRLPPLAVIRVAADRHPPRVRRRPASPRAPSPVPPRARPPPVSSLAPRATHPLSAARSPPP
ncbi:hypothetical protein ABZP36_015298 [Zizania latifolia]